LRNPGPEFTLRRLHPDAERMRRTVADWHVAGAADRLTTL
jgi:hypothetical protein